MLEWHVPVLMYHLVATSAEAPDALPGLVVSPDLFAAQMRTLRLAGWHTITARALAADLDAGTPPPSLTFVVTFDDGHADGFSEAFPILEANGFVATYYVITGRVGAIGYLSADNLVTMARGGMEIGDHSMNHLRGLTAVSETDATAEIVGAADFIKSLLGAPPTTFAYPFGDWNSSVLSDVRSAGLRMAFTTVGGCWESEENRFVVPRVRVTPWMTAQDLLDTVTACEYL